MFDNKGNPATGHKPENLSRRMFLGGCAGLTAGLILPAGVAAALPKGGERVLSFYNTHTGEQVTTPYWIDGEYNAEGLKDLRWLLRDHRIGKAHDIDTRLLDIVYALQQKIGAGKPGKPFHIISGYRSPKTNSMLSHKGRGVAKKSLHMQGKAIDIRLPHYNTLELRKAALSLNAGGVGYYQRSNFVHLDVGRVRSW
ncbi:MAG TPA: DUF882 domain-containing protein [Gammaproteobacteria bacterium]|nr:DUF882 domain-containing protein [Gammaproteobacteria bacterium]